MNNKFPHKLIVFSLALLMLAWAGNTQSHVLGWLEWAWLQPGAIKIKTKLDTGAKTSSIDAIKITPFERDGEPWVRYTVPLARRLDDSDRGKDLQLESPVERIVKIKEHDHEANARYVVNLIICIGGQTFNTPASLADRRHFNYPLLLGRSALKNRAIIDPGKTFTASKTCGDIPKN